MPEDQPGQLDRVVEMEKMGATVKPGFVVEMENQDVMENLSGVHRENRDPLGAMENPLGAHQGNREDRGEMGATENQAAMANLFAAPLDVVAQPVKMVSMEDREEMDAWDQQAQPENQEKTDAMEKLFVVRLVVQGLSVRKVQSDRSGRLGEMGATGNRVMTAKMDAMENR